MRLNEISGKVVDSAFRVHSELGPGLLESAYQACLAYELRNRGLEVQTEVMLPVCYREVTIDLGYRLDLVVAGRVVVELKSVRQLQPIHDSQVLTYLKLSGLCLGLLLNFNVRHFKNGIKRLVHNFSG